MIGILKPTLQTELSWNDKDFAGIIFWFQAAYTVGYIGFGRLVDRIGAKVGYAAAFVIWTLAHILHGAAGSVAGFSAARVLLGLGESGNFPAGLKAIADWFPPRERALATGIFNAGANVGAIVTPFLVPILVVTYGWRAAFVITGIASLAWLVAWFVMYRLPPDAAARAAITAQQPSPRYATLLRQRETWAFAIAKLLTDPIWWLFLFWLPDFLSRRHGLDLLSFGPPLLVIYLMSDLGSVAGGWVSSTLMRRGAPVNRARKIAMLICALAITPIFFAQYIDSLWGAVAIISVAAAGHQAWSANLFTLPSDMFPRGAIGTVIGLGGAAGGIGGMMIATYTGFVLSTFGNYGPIFVVAGSVYLIALLIIHLLVPTISANRSLAGE
ncbi:MFS transporter [Sphingomonas sp. CL5.1]|nr:MFS transporter [Sphingomonas sp. CL5.1]